MRHLASVLAVALVAIGFVALIASARTASAHDNCVHSEAAGWQLAGCVLEDGTVSWSGIDPNGDLHLWTDGEWVKQDRPPLPAYQPVITVPTSTGFPITGAGTNSLDPYVEYEAITNSESNEVESYVRIETATGSIGRAWLQIGCASGAMSVSFLHEERFPHLGPTQLRGALALYLVIDGRPIPHIGNAWARFDTKEAADYLKNEFLFSANLSVAEARGDAWIYGHLRNGMVLEMSARMYNDPAAFRFNLQALFGTPVQANIDRCRES